MHVLNSNNTSHPIAYNVSKQNLIDQHHQFNLLSIQILYNSKQICTMFTNIGSMSPAEKCLWAFAQVVKGFNGIAVGTMLISCFKKKNVCWKPTLYKIKKKLIGNQKILLIKKKVANRSTLGMYYGGKNQEPKLQCSNKAGREEQEKYDKTTLQTRRVCKKKDLISSKDLSHPLKHLGSFPSKYNTTSSLLNDITGGFEIFPNPLKICFFRKT